MYTAIIHLTLEEKDLECHVDYSYDKDSDEFMAHEIYTAFPNWLESSTCEDVTWLREFCFEEIKVKCLEVYEEEKSGYL